MQTVIVYIIVATAVLVSAWLTYRRLTRPQDCRSAEGCKDCPLIDKCEKKSQD